MENLENKVEGKVEKGSRVVCVKDYSPYLRVCFLKDDESSVVDSRGVSVAVKSDRTGRVITFATKNGYEFPLFADYFKLKD
jgi:hypothetical protein